MATIEMLPLMVRIVTNPHPRANCFQSIVGSKPGVSGKGVFISNRCFWLRPLWGVGFIEQRGVEVFGLDIANGLFIGFRMVTSLVTIAGGTVMTVRCPKVGSRRASYATLVAHWVSVFSWIRRGGWLGVVAVGV